MKPYPLELTDDALIIGVDEAGRGPWAGPVVAGAVIFTPELLRLKVNDSKALSKLKRKNLYDEITSSVPYAIGIADAEEIDNINILQATFLAMKRAVESLLPEEEKDPLILVDGNRLPSWDYRSEAIVKGDSVCMSIAAASIVAKVARDNIMASLAKEYPVYGWEKNSGYGVEYHRSAMEKYGVTPYHRRSYAPVKKTIQSGRRFKEVKLSGVIEDVVQPIAEKRGYVESHIIANWSDVLGERWRGRVDYDRVVFIKGQKNDGVLHVNVSNVDALELQHESFRFIEKVNMILGFNAISELRFSPKKMSNQVEQKNDGVEKVKKGFSVLSDPTIIQKERDMIADIEDEALSKTLNSMLDTLLQK